MAFSITDIIILCIIALFSIIGLFKGIVNKFLGILSLVGSLALAFYISTPISTLFLDTQFYLNMANAIGHGAASTILVLICGIVSFLIIFIIFKIISKLLNSLVNKSSGFLKFVNKFFGLCLGFLTGLTFATIYLLIFFGLSKVSDNINEFFINDLEIEGELFTFSKFLLHNVLVLFK